MAGKSEGRYLGAGKRPIRKAQKTPAIYYKQLKKATLPRLNPLVRIGIERFIAEIETTDFYSRQFNTVLPELLMEALRIEREERP